MADQAKGIGVAATNPEVIRAVRELSPSVGGQTYGADELALLRRAMEMLDGVSQLLKALAPPEIEAATARVYLGRLEHAPDVFWKMYATRHRVLADVFANLHADFEQRARRHFARRPPAGPETAR